MSHERRTPAPAGTGGEGNDRNATQPIISNDRLQQETIEPTNPHYLQPQLIPAHVFPLPNSHIDYETAGAHLFTILAQTNEVFQRNGFVHEVRYVGDSQQLSPVSPTRFLSLLDGFSSRRVAKYEVSEKGAVKWRSCRFTKSAAEVLLTSDPAMQYLPAITTILKAPIVAKAGHDSPGCHERLGAGYHPHVGKGTFIAECEPAPLVPVEVAVPALLGLLADFDFAAPGDASRAVASLISPAMKSGGWIDDDFPLDLAEADQSQAGKTYRQECVAAIYNEQRASITATRGGVGSLDEAVASALIAGSPFIALDNLRGRIDSPLLETAIRGSGSVRCRALRTSCVVDTRPFLWQLSTNGAELTRDLANRSIITRIRKREQGYVFRKFPEGDLLRHIKANQPFLLGCVHAVIIEWWKNDAPRTDESRHDFRTWCGAMDWIVQNVFSFPPLLDGHREEQLRTANPKLQWLRDIINAMNLKPGGEAVVGAAELSDIAEENEINLPGPPTSSKPREMRIGSIMGRIFKEVDSDVVHLDGNTITRVIEHEHDPIRKEHRERKKYVISRG